MGGNISHIPPPPFPSQLTNAAHNVGNVPQHQSVSQPRQAPVPSSNPYRLQQTTSNPWLWVVIIVVVIILLILLFQHSRHSNQGWF
jgi:uncharacterized integral membrane protein